MPRRLRRSPQAVYDVTDCYRFIARDNVDAADQFLLAAEVTFRKLAEMPGAGRVWESHQPRLARIRVLHLSSPFENYLVFYHNGRSGVRILRVLHAAGDLPALFL